MPISKNKLEIKQLQKLQALQDDCLKQADLLNRRSVWAENLKKAKNATNLYQRYKNSPEQFKMTFSEYKRRQRSS
jgi:hypothetical protein